MNRMTVMDKRLQIYVPLLDFLSAILGEDTEVVLQDLTKGFDHSLVYIRNNLSNREVGAPATDFVLDIVQSKLYKCRQIKRNEPKIYVRIYFGDSE